MLCAIGASRKCVAKKRKGKETEGSKKTKEEEEREARELKALTVQCACVFV